MRLLILFFFTCSCTYAGRAIFNCAQQEVLKKLKEDTKELEEGIQNLIRALEDRKNITATNPPVPTNKTPPTNPPTVPSPAPQSRKKAALNAENGPGLNTVNTDEVSKDEKNPLSDPQKKQVDDAIAKLKDFPAKSMEVFLINISTDLFPEDTIKTTFDQVDYLLSGNEFLEALQFCRSSCKHPFPTLSEESSKDDNLKKLKSAKESYGDRPTHDEARRNIVSYLKEDIPRLEFLKESIQYELPTDDAASITFPHDLPKDFNLSAEVLADFLKKSGPQQPGARETLKDLSKVLRAARSAIAACQVVPDTDGSSMCSHVPFLFTMDPSMMKVFDDIVADYEAREKPN